MNCSCGLHMTCVDSRSGGDHRVRLYRPAWIARERDALGRLVAEVAAAEALSHAEDVDLEGPARVAYQTAIGKVFDAYREWRKA